MATEPLSIEEAADSLLSPIEPETEAEDDGETQEDETQELEAETEDDEAEDEDPGEDDPGDEASDDDESEGEEEAEPDDSDDSERTYTVKVNGEEVKVSEQELKNNYAGRAALHERHETLKAQEGKIQEYAQTLQQERQQLLQLVQQAQENGFQQPPKEPDPELMKTDPIGYMEAEATYRQEVKAFQQQQQQLQYQAQQAQQQTEQQKQAELAKQREILLEAIPELSDPQKGKQVQKAWVETAKAYGFSQEDLSNVTDARTFKMLDDARRYRELQAGKQAAKKPREEPKAVTKPKAKPRDGGKQAMAKKKLQQARKSQSLDDWADLLLE